MEDVGSSEDVKNRLIKAPGCFFTVEKNRICLWTVLSTRLTDRISNSRLCEKCGSIPLSRAIIRERLRFLGYVLRMKNDILPKIVLVGQPSKATRKARRPRLGWEILSLFFYVFVAVALVIFLFIILEEHWVVGISYDYHHNMNSGNQVISIYTTKSFKL